MLLRLIILLFSFLFCHSVLAEERFCASDLLVFDARFDGGELDKCKFKADGDVELTFRPEDFRVDDAFSWFSFRVSATEPTTATIRLKFPDSYARFWPKLSTDGLSWTPMPEDSVTVSRTGRNMDLTVAVGDTDVWISAQELLTQDYYDRWLDELNAHGEFHTAVIGQSTEGRPIHVVKNSNKPEAVFLLGRQHPTEVPGAIAMREFIKVVLGDSDLAQRFRQRFTLIIIPLVNPDGVANGNSRHNAGKTDLNRDWGPFTQVETRSIAALLAAVDELEMQPRLMLDFHATRMTKTMIFYTQIDDDVTNPVNFAANWLGQVRSRIPEYDFKHDPRPISEQKNTKGYFYRRYGIPSITYEIADEEDRNKILQHTPVFAEEMMRELLRP